MRFTDGVGVIGSILSGAQAWHFRRPRAGGLQLSGELEERVLVTETGCELNANRQSVFANAQRH